MSKLSWTLPLLLLLAHAPVSAQEIASDPPSQWQADAKANKKAQKRADKAARRAAPRGGAPNGGGPGGPSGDEMGPPGGQSAGTPPGGTGGDNMGDNMGGPAGGPPEGGGGPGGGHKRHQQTVLLRPEMEFAAPLEDTLVLYRTREAVVFGTAEGSDVVILPLSGAPVQVAPGVQAFLHDRKEGMQVEIKTSNEIHVTFDYSTDPKDPGTLHVKVHAVMGSGLHTPPFDVERIYHHSTAH